MTGAGTALPTIANIQQAVARELGVPVRWMREPAPTHRTCSNGYDASHPRQTAMALTYLLTDHSRANVGRFFGGSDPTTVRHACIQVAKRRAQDAGLDRMLKRVSLDLVVGL